MNERQVIIVDVETTGLDPRAHAVVEVAWWNLTTGDRGEFIPPHDPHDVLATADIDALRINRYVDRIPGLPQDEGWVRRDELWTHLDGNTLAGSNPAFDAGFLATIAPGRLPAHHRLLDLSAYAAGVLDLPVSNLPSLATVCNLLGVVLRDAHTAAGDVEATGECFLRLFDIVDERRVS